MRISTSERPVSGRAGVLRAGALLLAVLLCGTLAGCYASQDAATARETPDIPGVDGAVGMMVLDDVYLDTATAVPPGGSVAVRGAFSDEAAQPDRLVAVTTPLAATVELLSPDGTAATDGIEVPAQGQVDATTGPVLIRLTGLTQELSPGAIVPVTFEFATAGRVTLDDVPATTPEEGQE
jgi:copper(I)-binding protein